MHTNTHTRIFNSRDDECLYNRFQNKSLDVFYFLTFWFLSFPGVFFWIGLSRELLWQRRDFFVLSVTGHPQQYGTQPGGDVKRGPQTCRSPSPASTIAAWSRSPACDQLITSPKNTERRVFLFPDMERRLIEERTDWLRVSGDFSDKTKQDRCCCMTRYGERRCTEDLPMDILIQQTFLQKTNWKHFHVETDGHSSISLWSYCVLFLQHENFFFWYIYCVVESGWLLSLS